MQSPGTGQTLPAQWPLHPPLFSIWPLKFQNVNWFIRNIDFPVNSFWKISKLLGFATSQFCSFSVLKLLSFKTSWFWNFSVLQLLCFETSWFQNFAVLKLLGFETSRFRKFSVSKLLRFGSSWFRNFAVSKLCGFANSWFRKFSVLQLLGFTTCWNFSIYRTQVNLGSDLWVRLSVRHKLRHVCKT